MSFLAPLYLLAGLAISLPIVFHLIRRTPKGRRLFSSVMFLSPSPPRITRRSRIEDWLLLILRGLAVALLACTFARPFLREQENIAGDVAPSRRVAVLLDASASMRRSGYWEQALRDVQNVVGELDLHDALSLTAFDSQVRELLTFDDWRGLAPGARAGAVLDLLRDIHPTWESTAAGQAMIFAAEQLDAEAEQSKTLKTLVVISDMQAGGGWEALSAVTWPDDVVVRLVPISIRGQQTNATVQAVNSDDLGDGILRIRVSNAANSNRESFQIGWADEFGKTSTSTPVYVPPGESRVVRAPQAADNLPERLVLSGDDVEFDNLCFLANRQSRRIKLVYFGPADEALSPSGLKFFLAPMFPSTAARQVEIVDWAADASQPQGSVDALSLLIIGGDLGPDQLEWTRNWTEAGGQTLFVARNPQQAMSLYSLLSLAPVEVQEATLANYAMLGKVDLNHPVLRVFDDPRFSDFTKLRFWHYRRFAADTLPGLHVLASFEDSSPALAEIPVGAGRIMLLASGWNRDDSDLAVWSKFVPLMNGLLDYVAQGPAQIRPAKVGDTFSLSTLEFSSPRVLVQIDGQTLELDRDEKLQFDQPGIYRFAESAEQLASDAAVRVAVNLDPSESRTEPLPMEVLESAGVKLESRSEHSAELQAQRQHQQRQLMNQELEARQQIWRWLLISALGLLLLETALAGWRRSSAALTT